MHNVVIGIQARSTSTRLPNKCSMYIGQRTMLDHVIDKCKQSARKINETHGLKCDVVLLTPFNDPLIDRYQGRLLVIDGPENDVLSRYMKIYEVLDNVDYICRITSDCPFIPPHYITKHVREAVNGSLDYCSNVDPNMRTAPDGYDCEVMSTMMMEWLDTNAKKDEHREHVTLLAKTNRPSWAKIAAGIGFIDFSNIKLSVDTEDDLKFMINQDSSIGSKLNYARETKTKVFRL